MKNRNIPFGYKFEDGKIIIDTAEQHTFNRICSDYLNGQSLLQIAKKLESEKIEFAPGITTWNKARIMRIVDDDRYLGDTLYPQIIDQMTIEMMRRRKASRNTQTKTDRQSGIYLLKSPIHCPACGSEMHRLQDKRCRCHQKWICDECNTQIKIEDSALMKEIVELMNTVIADPERIQKPSHKETEVTIEQRRLDNEIARTLEGYDFDKDALRKKLLQRVSLNYQSISNETYVASKLQDTLQQWDVLKDFAPELINKVVKQIRLAENGSISIILINGQEIRKE